MKSGDIIYHENLIFIDGHKDEKLRRPCIYLFSETRIDGEYVYSIPLTSNIKQFNKHPDTYVFVPEVVYNYRKLSFAKIDNCIISKIEDIVETGLSINDFDFNVIVEKLEQFETKNTYKTDLNRLKTLLLYFKLFDELSAREDEKNKKQLKILKKQLQKG